MVTKEFGKEAAGRGDPPAVARFSGHDVHRDEPERAESEQRNTRRGYAATGGTRESESERGRFGVHRGFR